MYVSKPTIDCRNKGIDVVCEQWVVVSLALIIRSEVMHGVMFNQVDISIGKTCSARILQWNKQLKGMT